MGGRLLRVVAGICFLALIVAPLATVGVAQQGSGGLAASLPTLTSPGPSTIDNCGPATFTITVHNLAGGQRAQGQLTAVFILPTHQRQVVGTTPVDVVNPAGAAPISFSRSISLPPAAQWQAG